MFFLKKIKTFLLVFILLFLPIFSFTAKAGDLITDFSKNAVIYSEKQQLIGEKTFFFEDKVLLLFQDFTLEAEQLFIDFKSGYGKATGRVRAISGDIEVFSDSIEFDLLLESIKITNSQVSFNDLIHFSAGNIFLNKGLIKIQKFRFQDDDSKLPLKYSILLDLVNLSPLMQGRFFYLQFEDLNFSLADTEKISPINFPAYDFYLRNPLIPRDYPRQRRVRGFFEPGQFFFSFGYDAERGPSATGSLTYFSNEYSNGFLTVDYGLFSNFDFSIYHDLTDNKGNLLQFNTSFRLKEPILTNLLNSGSLSLLHDWRNETLRLNISWNQPFGKLLVSNLPELTFFSIFKEAFAGITYRYNLSVARMIAYDPKNKNNFDFGRLRLGGNINSPRFYLLDSLSIQLLTEGFISSYLAEGNLSSFSGQIELTHDIFKNFQYSLRFRQKITNGKSPLEPENIPGNQFLGLYLNWWLTESLELASFSELNINQISFNSSDLILNYFTRQYQFSLYFDLLNINFNGNVKLINF